MKLSIIHSLYQRNLFVNETVRLNLMALEQSGIDYQYILFNDKGDKKIKDDVKEFLCTKKVEYVYSKTNFGRKLCSGGWLGALPYVKGDLIQGLQGQDDVMSALFYKISIDAFENISDIYLTFANCFIVTEKLEVISFGMNPQFSLNYSDPIASFKFWFGIDGQLNQVTKANNNMMAPGVIYKKELHDLVGLPDLDEFGGAGDFEYWARILFNGYKCHYINQALWLYRKSEYSAGNAIVDGKPNRGYWQQHAIEKIKQKYFDLWEERKTNNVKI